MLLIYAVILGLSAFTIPRIPASSFSQEMNQEKLPAGILRIVIACGALLFLYVGIEVGISGWLPTFATRLHAFSLQRAALLQDTFWTTFLLGRLFAPAFLKVTGERVLLTLSICTATAGTVALLLLHLPIVLFASVAMIGLGCAAVFPTAIALLSQRLSGYSGSTLGFMFASAGLGAAILPFSIGSLSSATHNLRIGMSLLLVAEIGLVIAHLVMSRLSSGAAQFDPARQRAIATGGAQ
jgi:fucose permease